MVIIILGEITKELSNKFFAKPVQDILVKLTHVNIQKAFRKRFIGQDPDTPIYKFMTTAEVEKVSCFCFLIIIYSTYGRNH
jgi:hypothetical protein